MKSKLIKSAMRSLAVLVLGCMAAAWMKSETSELDGWPGSFTFQLCIYLLVFLPFLISMAPILRELRSKRHDQTATDASFVQTPARAVFRRRRLTPILLSMVCFVLPVATFFGWNWEKGGMIGYLVVNAIAISSLLAWIVRDLSYRLVIDSERVSISEMTFHGMKRTNVPFTQIVSAEVTQMKGGPVAVLDLPGHRKIYVDNGLLHFQEAVSRIRSSITTVH